MDWNIAVILLGLIPIFTGLRKTPVSGWLKSESMDRLYVGPPITERICGVLGALAAMAPSIVYLRPTAYISPWITWFVLVPWIALMSCACLWFAGSREVYINLVYRTCQRAGGWLFFVKKGTFQLTEKSVIYVYGSRDEAYVVLWIGDNKAPKFSLGPVGNRNKALAFAQKIGSLAQIHVQETTAAAMRGRMSARKRSQMDRE